MGFGETSLGCGWGVGDSSTTCTMERGSEKTYGIKRTKRGALLLGARTLLGAPAIRMTSSNPEKHIFILHHQTS